jgi:tetratricopeptide (TPR) repeat protein
VLGSVGRTVIKTFGRLFFIAFGLLLAVVAVLFFAWAGVLGSYAEQKIKELCDSALDFYNFHREAIHAALPWLGAIASAVWAALVFARAWHYADQTLPQRLEDYNLRAAQKIAGQRHEVLAFLSPKSLTGHSSGWSLTAFLHQRRLQQYVVSLPTLSNTLDLRIRTLDTTRRVCAVERATVHIATAQSIESEINSRTSDSIAPDELEAKRGCVRDEYRRAAALDADAAKYLLPAVEQSIALGQDDEAIKDIESLRRASIDHGTRAMALFRFAEILYRKGAGTECQEWADARDHLNDIGDLLAQHATRKDEQLLRAKAAELLGRVHMKRKRYTAALTALRQARDIFESHDPAAARRIDQTINNINGEQEDAGDPGL